VLAWLRRLPADHSVAAIGHEPDLGVLASYLLAGRRESFVPFKKGGACLMYVPAAITPGTSVLEWLMTPRQLRYLAR
jgi:phosphohistidine phosphatase